MTEHINALKKHRDAIVQQMNNPNGIMNHLLSANILNDVEVNVIYREETKSEKIKVLLNILMSKPDSAFKGLREALMKDDQRHLAKPLGNLFAYFFKPFVIQHFCYMTFS